MVAVAGLWELGWNTPIKEADLWEYVLRDFGVQHWYMSPVSGINHSLVREREQMVEVIAEHRAAQQPIVFVDERGMTPLREFVHPADALYVFGKASLSPLAAYGQPGDQSVVIETPLRAGILWPHQALAIVLYDRQVKAWR